MRNVARCMMFFTLIVALPGAAAPVHAQRNEATLEASIFRGTVGYARATSPRTYVGVEVGFGFPQIDRTLVPAQDTLGRPDFEEYLHIGVFVRQKLTDRIEVDAGLRGSIVDLWSCSSSDCWFELFGGGYVQPMVGWQRVKFGMRLSAGWVTEREEGTPQGNSFSVGLAPFLVRATLPF